MKNLISLSKTKVFDYLKVQNDIRKNVVIQ